MESNTRMVEQNPQQNDFAPLEIEIKKNQVKPQQVVGKHHHLHRHQTILRQLGRDRDLNNNPQEFDIQEDIQTYLDMQMLNPDWEFAQKHAKASRPGLRGKQHERQQCICCFKQINKNEVPLCENSKELQFLGFGFPLYFIFLKFTLIILLLLIVNYTAIELYWSISHNYDFCVRDIPRDIHGHSVHCTGFMILLSTIDLHLNTQEHILRISSFITLLIAMIYMRDHFTKTWRYYDERETTYANFAVFIENLPRRIQLRRQREQHTIGRKLRDFFNNQSLFPNKPRIAHINLIGEFDELHKLQEERKEYMHELEKITHQNNDLTAQYRQKNEEGNKEEELNKIFSKKVQIKTRKKQLCAEVRQVVDKLAVLKINLKKEIESQDIDCDQAIVCFETQQEMQDVKMYFKSIKETQMTPYFKSKASKIVFGTAARPGQILWQNINEGTVKRVHKTILSWVIFVFILAVLSTGFYFLFNWKSNLVVSADDRDARIIVFVSLIALILFNKFILSWIIHHLVDMELCKTGMGYQFSFMLKYSIGLFFISAVMTILVQGVTHKNVYTHKFGIIEEQTLMYFFVAGFIPLIWLVNPWYIFQWIQRKRHMNSPFVTQQQANQIMQDPEYIMGKRYGQILQAFWFTFLYACVIPIGSICLFIGLSFYYWVDKYNLLRKSSIKEGVSGKLAMKALMLLEMALIIKPGGQLIFDWLIRSEWNVIPVIQICIGFVYMILPTKRILDFIHPQKFNFTPKTYTQHKENNFFSYQVYNPLSKQEELKKYFNDIEVCTNKDHKHEPNQSHRNLVLNGEKDYYKISRPHQSAKKKVELFSQSDFDARIQEIRKIQI